MILDLLQTEEMYEIPDVHGFNVPIISSYTQRLLQEESATLTDEKEGIHMTGNGLVGILMIFLILIPILTVVLCMHDIFVNTKVVDKPILMGKIDS